MIGLVTQRRAAVIAEALSWQPTPYHHKGRLKHVGVDCAMYPAEAYAAVGEIPPVVIEDYPPDWHQHQNAERYLAMVTRFAAELPPGVLPQPGDFLLVRIGKCLAHGAIVINWPTIIHAVKGHGVIQGDACQRTPLFWDKDSGDYRERHFFTLWPATTVGDEA